MHLQFYNLKIWLEALYNLILWHIPGWGLGLNVKWCVFIQLMVVMRIELQIIMMSNLTNFANAFNVLQLYFSRSTRSYFTQLSQLFATTSSKCTTPDHISSDPISGRLGNADPEIPWRLKPLYPRWLEHADTTLHSQTYCIYLKKSFFHIHTYPPHTYPAHIKFTIITTIIFVSRHNPT